MRRSVFYAPYTIFLYLALVMLVALAALLLLFDVLQSAFVKVGFSWDEAFLLLLGSLIGSNVNIPVATLHSRGRQTHVRYVRVFGIVYRVPVPTLVSRTTVVAVNVGGAVIPAAVSAYLLVRFSHAIPMASVATAIVAVAVYRVARPVEGVGIVAPALVAPLAAGLATVALTAAFGAPTGVGAGERLRQRYVGDSPRGRHPEPRPDQGPRRRHVRRSVPGRRLRRASRLKETTRRLDVPEWFVDGDDAPTLPGWEFETFTLVPN